MSWISRYKETAHNNDGLQHFPCLTPNPPLAQIPPELQITSMKLETRRTRTTNNPGIVDLPKSRRSPAEVATEKMKKKEVIAAKAQKRSEKAARVARVEKEMKLAQKEAAQSSRMRSRVEKTFAREMPQINAAAEVSISLRSFSESTRSPHSHRTHVLRAP